MGHVHSEREHAHSEREHQHDHGHGASHDHRPEGRRRLTIALAVTATFMVAEAIGGWLANSQALMADAGHMLSDVGALSLALVATHFAARPATGRKSYGWLRLEILAALANGVVLVGISAGISWEAIERLRAPEPVHVPLMLGVAAVGLVANLVSARILHGAHEGHLNVGAAYAHVISDLLGSVGAITGGLIMWWTGWYAVDAMVALAVGLLILGGAWLILKQATDILLEGVPAHVEIDSLQRDLAAVDGVRSIHDLHVWTISSGVHLMTCHAVVGGHGDHHDVLERLSCLVRERYRIDHTTIQLECEDLSERERAGGVICHRC